jgi:hypothetical protein
MWVWLPHSTQNDFTQPSSSGRQERSCSSPSVIRNDPGSMRAVTEKALSLRRWHRLQWQYRAPRNGRVISKRTAPHMQRPVSGEAVDALMPAQSPAKAANPRVASVPRSLARIPASETV